VKGGVAVETESALKALRLGPAKSFSILLCKRPKKFKGKSKTVTSCLLKVGGWWLREKQRAPQGFGGTPSISYFCCASNLTGSQKASQEPSLLAWWLLAGKLCTVPLPPEQVDDLLEEVCYYFQYPGQQRPGSGAFGK